MLDNRSVLQRRGLRAAGSWRPRVGFLAVVASGLLLICVASDARSEGPPPKNAKSKAAQPSPSANPQPVLLPLSEVKPQGALATQYCSAVRDVAAEARFAVQVAQLEALAKQLDDRLAKIDARSAELKEWLAKREEFARKATDQLVGIFAAMRAEPASEQLTRLDARTAAAILSKIELRAASTILNEMPPEKAAKLTAIMALAARRNDTADKP
ncbi:MAG: MotE family protein [Hyphomicrobiaceae bacterium]